MSYPFTNLVFEGGGVKGIAYIGALQALRTRGVLKSISRIGGASAGAITAVLLALKYDLKDIRKILWSLDFSEFMDDSWGVVRDTSRLINEFGWYKGDFFRSWMGNLVREKTGNEHSTFNDLKNREYLNLYLIGTNLSTGFSEVFSYEHTPRMRVVDAARISMSIPLFFAAVRNFRNDVYVDGGVLNNYPIKLFDREKYVNDPSRGHGRATDYYDDENKRLAKSSSKYVYNRETLGFRLDSGQEIGVFRDGAERQHKKIDDFFEYAWSLIMSMAKIQENQHLHSDDWHRTVYINTIGVGTTDFEIPDKTKKRLVAEGRKGVDEYFAWYDDVTLKVPPINRPDQPTS